VNPEENVWHIYGYQRNLIFAWWTQSYVHARAYVS